MMIVIMGTEKHSIASKKRWQKVPDKVKFNRMSSLSKSGWDKLGKKARRKRALDGVRTRKANLLKRTEENNI